MRDLFKFELRPSYPHMNFRDVAIWERFIVKFPGAYNHVQYDFHVGEAPAFNTLDDDGTDRNQDMLYRKRIDVVGETDETIDIIEVKPDAGVSAFGQLKAYGKLYARDEEPKKPIRLILLTDKENPDMAWLGKQDGVILVVV